ncbi:hypothetical protein DIPPA_54908 [Diplonema papillatum]|nr:hypothetical protein DIPPA_54908 [Diplonema papillatum]
MKSLRAVADGTISVFAAWNWVLQDLKNVALHPTNDQRQNFVAALATMAPWGMAKECLQVLSLMDETGQTVDAMCLALVAVPLSYSGDTDSMNVLRQRWEVTTTSTRSIIRSFSNSLLNHFTKQSWESNGVAATEVLTSMAVRGVPPDSQTYELLIASSPSEEASRRLQTEMKRAGFVVTSQAYNALLAATLRQSRHFGIKPSSIVEEMLLNGYTLTPQTVAVLLRAAVGDPATEMDDVIAILKLQTQSKSSKSTPRLDSKLTRCLPPLLPDALVSLAFLVHRNVMSELRSTEVLRKSPNSSQDSSYRKELPRFLSYSPVSADCFAGDTPRTLAFIDLLEGAFRRAQECCIPVPLLAYQTLFDLHQKRGDTASLSNTARLCSKEGFPDVHLSGCTHQEIFAAHSCPKGYFPLPMYSLLPDKHGSFKPPFKELDLQAL